MSAVLHGRDAQLFAVFGHGAAGNVDALLVEELVQHAVGVGFAFVFVIDKLADNGFDGVGAQAFFGVAADCVTEEIA